MRILWSEIPSTATMECSVLIFEWLEKLREKGLILFLEIPSALIFQVQGMQKIRIVLGDLALSSVWDLFFQGNWSTKAVELKQSKKILVAKPISRSSSILSNLLWLFPPMPSKSSLIYRNQTKNKIINSLNTCVEKSSEEAMNRTICLWRGMKGKILTLLMKIYLSAKKFLMVFINC